MKKIRKRPMELGVLSRFAEDDSNPFDVIARYGVATTQLCNWDMAKWTKENAKKVKRDLKSSGVRLAALWTGYSGTVIWDLIDGPDTMGIVPEYTRKRRIADLKAGADFAARIGAPAIITHCGFIPETPKSRQKTGSIQSAPIPSIIKEARITKPVSRTMPPTFGADMASCIRPRWDREMRRPDKSEKDAPTVITPKPPIWISTINTA